MLELIASIGVLGILTLVVGYIAIFWLAQVIDARNPYDDEGEKDE